MRDSFFCSFHKVTHYIADSYNAYAAPMVSKVPYANEVITASLFASTPIVSMGANLYQMIHTGVSLESMAAVLVDTAMHYYALPFATRTAIEMISNITGLNAELLNIPAQIGTQVLYSKVKIFCNLAVLDIKDVNGERALIRAVKNHDINTVDALIQAGANLDLRDRNSNTALIWAALTGKMERAKALIDAGAKLDLQNEYGDTALILAAQYGYTDIFNALIQAGAQLDLQDRNSNTALILAASNWRDTDPVNALIQAGAKLDLQNKHGDTALILAATNSRTENVNALIQAGANLNLQDKDGNTALIFAVWQGHTHTIKALIQAGADITLIDNNGNTALTIAAQRVNVENAFCILRAMTFQQIATALQKNPELKEEVNRFREKENEEAINHAALDKEDYLNFAARMSLKWQAGKKVAKQCPDQELINKNIPEDVIKIVEASRQYARI